jgi:hypothetical protein
MAVGLFADGEKNEGGVLEELAWKIPGPRELSLLPREVRI